MDWPDDLHPVTIVLAPIAFFVIVFGALFGGLTGLYAGIGLALLTYGFYSYRRSKTPIRDASGSRTSILRSRRSVIAVGAAGVIGVGGPAWEFGKDEGRRLNQEEVEEDWADAVQGLWEEWGDPEDADDPVLEQELEGTISPDSHRTVQLEPDRGAELQVLTSSENPLDVILMEESEYQKYTDRESASYISAATNWNSEDVVNTADISPGEYRLVIDNSDFGQGLPEGPTDFAAVVALFEKPEQVP